MSATAALVQLGIAVEAERGHSDGLPPETLQLAQDRLGGWARNPIVRAGLLALQAATVPGLSRHFVERKRWIRSRAEAALSRGIRRVVILGAGNDGLGPYLAGSHAALEVVEVHRPEDLRSRRQRLLMQDMLADNLILHGFDLSRGMPPSVRDGNSDATLLIAEGVLMYLPRHAACRLMRSAIDSWWCREIILSFAVPRPDGRLAFARARPWATWWLALQREPWRWALPVGRAVDWLARRGFRTVCTAGVGIRPEARGDHVLSCPGECLLCARNY